MIPHDWDMSFEKFGGLPVNCGSFLRKLTSKAGTNSFSKYQPQWVQWSAPHHWMQNSTGHSVLKAIIIGWSQFQLAMASNKPLKLCLICRCGLLLLVAIWQENQQWALYKKKWWNWELTLATNLVSHAQIFTKVVGQNFGYQLWFCTGLHITGPQPHLWQG